MVDAALRAPDPLVTSVISTGNPGQCAHWQRARRCEIL